MRLFSHQREPRVGVLIVTGRCCIPGMAPLDERARTVVERAVAETGVTVNLQVMPATTAYFGGVSKAVIGRLMGDFQQSGKVGLPAVLINGELISAGVPEVETIKAALQAAGKPNPKEEPILE